MGTTAVGRAGAAGQAWACARFLPGAAGAPASGRPAGPSPQGTNAIPADVRVHVSGQQRTAIVIVVDGNTRQRKEIAATERNDVIC